ncbi:16S rRNA (guanine(966)-N(2))-methyltransferase RsmD [Virgibacillus ihumii]|uniref:16S rRNA (guanine(966)-N(2))-methyltransferase RsmD n=1 Tax=Virgibacillus ihumii TaxID=2686091 RepID=UPI00157CC783|nr:16S rRNA (guanine(966)-N(2))-methyltransferase RsmD [Virgibacillus ihumii]
MRIIAGSYKGRQLQSVPGKLTRPTTDKVKEAVFQVIGPFFNEGSCLDLFAGSGSLGLEALSRGMTSGVFVDKNPKAIHTIHENVKLLKLAEQTEIFRAEAFRALQAASKRNLQFDLIFLDPPYGKVSYVKLLERISNLQLLKSNGMIYYEHGTSEKMPKEIGSFLMSKQADYGGTISITIYKRR